MTTTEVLARGARAAHRLVALPGLLRAHLQRRSHDARFVRACRLGDLSSVALQLEHDPSLAWRQVSMRALHGAIVHDHVPVVTVLLDAGARDWFRHEMLHAVRAGAGRTVALLLALGFKPDWRYWTGGTPLMDAARAGRTDIVECLLGAGADPAWRDAHGMTAADHAAMNGHRAVVRALRRQAHDSEGTGDAA